MFIQDKYQKCINYAQMFISPFSLELAETAFSVMVPGALAAECASNPIFKAAAAIGFGVLGHHLHYKYLKIPAIEQNIKRIVEGSKAEDKPTALFIHTKNDHNGAFTCMHSTADVYRTCAKEFSIDRIRGFSYEEKMKVQGKKYDIIVILAHGHPASISMDGEGFFFGLHKHSSKSLNFLANRLKEGGKIILDSCSTAAGDENIAKCISERVPHATVFGSSAVVYGNVGVEFAPSMTPRFNDGRFWKGKDTTCIYQAGSIHK